MAERREPGEDGDRFLTACVAVKSALIAALVLVALTVRAENSDLAAIQDNSFLVEEAYNQETGVVQHISLFMRDRRSGDWLYTFTQEWPAPTQKNQLSYTIPVNGGTRTRLGDMLLNYRYQLLGSGETRTAIAPRLSVIIPTGGGSSAVQVALPVSHILASRLIAHSNAGATWVRDRRATDVSLGQSFIYALSRRVHLMAEATWTRTDGKGETLVSPGVRWAYNRPSGMQIVPGIAFPFGVGSSAGERSLLIYFSVEHPFR